MKKFLSNYKICFVCGVFCLSAQVHLVLSQQIDSVYFDSDMWKKDSLGTKGVRLKLSEQYDFEELFCKFDSESLYLILGKPNFKYKDSNLLSLSYIISCYDCDKTDYTQKTMTVLIFNYDINNKLCFVLMVFSGG